VSKPVPSERKLPPTLILSWPKQWISFGVDRRQREIVTWFLVGLLFSENFVGPREYFPRARQIEDPRFVWT
jgi:hypothetical protein